MSAATSKRSLANPTHWVFNRLAQAYRYRPAYPKALLTHLVELAGPSRRVVELGAGSGLLSLPLNGEGLQVTAVDPAAAMLEELEKSALRRGLEIKRVHATAEDTGLPSDGFSLVLAADAVQWMDPDLAGQEARRLMMPNGVCAAVEVHLSQTGFTAELQALWRKANPKAAFDHNARGEQFLRRASGKTKMERAHFEDETSLDEKGLEGLLRSFSFLEPALGERDFSDVVDQARRLAKKFGNSATWKRQLRLLWALGP